MEEGYKTTKEGLLKLKEELSYREKELKKKISSVTLLKTLIKQSMKHLSKNGNRNAFMKLKNNLDEKNSPANRCYRANYFH